MPQYPKRLIEVDLPIKRISAHARREKSIRHGHISTLHIWWARRPLAACRAVICYAEKTHLRQTITSPGRLTSDGERADSETPAYLFRTESARYTTTAVSLHPIRVVGSPA